MLKIIVKIIIMPIYKYQSPAKSLKVP